MKNPNITFTLLRLQRVLGLVFLVATGAIVLTGVAPAGLKSQSRLPDRAATANKIAPWVVEHTANGQQAEFFVLLADQANFSAAATMRTKTEKGRYVYNTLRNKKQATQGPILRWLREHRLEHRSTSLTRFW